MPAKREYLNTAVTCINNIDKAIDTSRICRLGLLNWPLSEPLVPHLVEKRAAQVEFLDAVVASIYYADIGAYINAYAAGIVELAVTGAAGSPFGEKRAAQVEFLDTAVAAINNVNIAASILGGDAARAVELAVV